MQTEAISGRKASSLFLKIKNFIFVNKNEEGFRTFHGVFLPSILSILGVILYLRMGWILGEMGLLSTLSIICFATSITLITALSISASSTNMFVGRGGAYFILSRSFGINIGSAIGIPLYLAQAIGIAFYIMGFSESLHYILPSLPLQLIEFSTLITLGIISIISTNLVMRTQLFIFFVIILSLISFFMGIESVGEVETHNTYLSTTGYWAAFALFFPAVTGLEAGVSMSGELKNPRRSLPLGTISAVIIGLIVYLSVTYSLWVRVPKELLISDTMIIEHIAWFGPLIIIGVFGATLSSALGSIMAAPRTLQAFSDDGIVPKIIGKEYGKSGEPRVASLITLAIAAICLYMGDLNFLAPILTMFFLISYAMLNLAAGLEGLMNNPSWRPTISVPFYVSIIGTSLCIIAMLLIDAGATMISVGLISVLYLVLTRKLNSSWDDIRQGILLFLSRYVIFNLNKTKFSEKSWRPNILAFSTSINPNPVLIDFVGAITEGKGFLTFLYSLTGNDKSANEQRNLSYIQSFLTKNKMEALVEFMDPDYVKNNLKEIIHSYGFGPLKPNTVIINLAKDDDYHLLLESDRKKRDWINKNLILLKVNEDKNDFNERNRSIDIWWDNDQQEQNELMILIGHMYCNRRSKSDTLINLNALVPSEIAKKHVLLHLTQYLSSRRLRMNLNVFVSSDIENDGFKIITHFSKNTSMTFLGIHKPDAFENIEAHKKYINHIISETKELSAVFLFQSHTNK